MKHTHQHYVPGCSLCELNQTYVAIITLEGLPQELHDDATNAYKLRFIDTLRRTYLLATGVCNPDEGLTDCGDIPVENCYLHELLSRKYPRVRGELRHINERFQDDTVSELQAMRELKLKLEGGERDEALPTLPGD